MNIYYMRDNHTFRKLSLDWNIAKTELINEINNGHTYGMLCNSEYPSLNVHAKGKKDMDVFISDCERIYKNIFFIGLGAGI